MIVKAVFVTFFSFMACLSTAFADSDAQSEAIAVTASAGASAGSEGTSASANANQSEAGYYKGMAVFTMGKGGLMYQATLGGQKYSYTPSK